MREKIGKRETGENREKREHREKREKRDKKRCPQDIPEKVAATGD